MMFNVRALWLLAGLLVIVGAALFVLNDQESEASIVGEFDYPDIPAYPLGAPLPDVSTSPAISPYFVGWQTADPVGEAAEKYSQELAEAGWSMKDPLALDSGRQLEATNSSHQLTAVVSELQPGSTSVMLAVYSK